MSNSCDSVCLLKTDSACKVLQNVFRYAENYQKLLNGVDFARKARSNGNNFTCATFIHPCTKKRTTLSGKRILEIVNNPSCVHYCSCNEKVAGLVLLNSNFFRTVWGSYFQALNAKNASTSYCKRFVIPKSLFPNVKKCTILLTGKQIISIRENC